MHRRAALRVAWIALLACALQAQDDPCVVRREGLPNPRKRLRYRGRLHETQSVRLEMWQALSRQVEDGGAPQDQEGPHVRLRLEVTPDRFENGVTFFGVRVVHAEASRGVTAPGQAALLRTGVAGLEGAVGAGAVAEDGSGASLRWEAVPEESQGLAEQVRALLLGGFVPLPAVPMGEDGQWVVKSTGERRPGEPEIKETRFTCSVIGDGAVVSATAGGKLAEAVEMPGTEPRVVRQRTETDVQLTLRLTPGHLFPAQSLTRAYTAEYTTGRTRFTDRQTLEFRLLGSRAPEAKRIAIADAGEDPRIPIEYPATEKPHSYAIEYSVHETKAADGRVEKRGAPRVRVVVRCRQWPQFESRFTPGWVMQWSIEEAGVVGDDPDAALDRTLEELGGLGGGGAYGRSCEAIVGYAPGPRSRGKRELQWKRPRMEPDVWIELPDDASPELALEAERLCEAVEWSMLRLPDKRYEAPVEVDRDPVVIDPLMGKGGTWRSDDDVRIPGARLLKRVLEHGITEVGEGSFTVSCRSEVRVPLGAAELDGATAELRTCLAKRTGSWTIARGYAMPRSADIADVLDREYEVTDADGSRKTIRFHRVLSVSIEALD